MESILVCPSDVGNKDISIVVEEVVRQLLFLRGQIPFTFQELQKKLATLPLKDSNWLRTNRKFLKDVLKFQKAYERCMSALSLILSTQRVTHIFFMIGTSINTPYEMFVLDLQELQRGSKAIYSSSENSSYNISDLCRRHNRAIIEGVSSLSESSPRMGSKIRLLALSTTPYSSIISTQENDEVMEFLSSFQLRPQKIPHRTNEIIEIKKSDGSIVKKQKLKLESRPRSIRNIRIMKKTLPSNEAESDSLVPIESFVESYRDNMSTDDGIYINFTRIEDRTLEMMHQSGVSLENTDGTAVFVLGGRTKGVIQGFTSRDVPCAGKKKKN
eukprot:GDKK01047647.1.p1 GENE.GDKK01047647.1~~GDKK01047647.1.p1  ORF type:complete len:328 (+),score=27.09 GDKK01047647.1:26-1009(+)